MTNDNSYDPAPGSYRSPDDPLAPLRDPGDSLPADPGSGSGDTADGITAAGAVGAARRVAESGAEQAVAVKDTAVAGATEVKDLALERGGEVVGVAKDELARLAGEARDQFQTLWSQASDQLREQAGNGTRQLADLLHSLAAELGQMAARSDNDGPLTALARQGAARGGELSHWLQQSEPADVLAELRRFARRRPFAFLAGAALAGVVVGRLSRGLMAANNDSTTVGSGSAAPARAVTTPAPEPVEPAEYSGPGSAGVPVGASGTGQGWSALTGDEGRSDLDSPAGGPR